MNKNEISVAVHDIKHMVDVAQRAADSLLGVESGKYQMPADDANLLAFAICDIEKRVKALQEGLDGC